MSTTNGPTARISWWSRLAFWTPLVLIGLLAGAVGLVWYMNVEGDPAYWRSFAVFWVVLAWCLIGIWLIIAPLPRMMKAVGIPIIVVVPVLFVALFRIEEFRVSGGMKPSIPWRWTTTPGERLAAHLKGAENRGVPDSVDLSGKRPTDWAQYLGVKRDSIVHGPALLRQWPTGGPKQLWKHPIGGGHAPFAVADKALFTIEQRGDQEAITCYDADTGKQIWAHTYQVTIDDRTRFENRMGDIGPRATPTVIDGEVFAIGATGMLHCLDARSGKLKWGPVDVLEGNKNNEWAMAGSPLVVDDAIIVSPGVQSSKAPHGTAIAYDRKSGDALWSTSTKYHGGYSSPMVATLAGQRQLLLFDGEGISGYALDDPKAKGKELWRYPWEAINHITVAQPLVLDGDRVFISDGYGGGCAMLKITNSGTGWAAEEVWKKKTGMSCKFSSPVFYQGNIYGLDYEYLACIDAETGKKKGRGEHYQFGQVLLVNDLLLVTGEFGGIALVDPAGGELKELGFVQALEGRSWNPPAVADGACTGGIIRRWCVMSCREIER